MELIQTPMRDHRTSMKLVNGRPSCYKMDCRWLPLPDSAVMMMLRFEVNLYAHLKFESVNTIYLELMFPNYSIAVMCVASHAFL